MSDLRAVPPVILIAGTHAIDDPWWMVGSGFVRMLQEAGLRVENLREPYLWDTDLDGLGRHNDAWIAAGWSLIWYCHKHVPPVGNVYQPVSIIAHSHGGQLVAYAASRGLIVDTLITVATPVRRDMLRIHREARPNIRQWVHLYSDWSDWMQVLGALFDGRIGVYRKMDLADRNIKVPGVGHSGLLNPALWRAQQWPVLLGGQLQEVPHDIVSP